MPTASVDWRFYDMWRWKQHFTDEPGHQSKRPSGNYSTAGTTSPMAILTIRNSTTPCVIGCDSAQQNMATR